MKKEGVVIGPQPRGRPRAAAAVPMVVSDEEEISEEDDEEEEEESFDTTVLSVDVEIRIEETGSIAVVESGDEGECYYLLMVEGIHELEKAEEIGGQEEAVGTKVVSGQWFKRQGGQGHRFKLITEKDRVSLNSVITVLSEREFQFNWVLGGRSRVVIVGEGINEKIMDLIGSNECSQD